MYARWYQKSQKITRVRWQQLQTTRRFECTIQELMCPVKIYRKYLSKRNTACDAFFSNTEIYVWWLMVYGLKNAPVANIKLVVSSCGIVALYGPLFFFFLADHRATDFTLSKICGTATKNSSHLSTVIFTTKRFVRAESYVDNSFRYIFIYRISYLLTYYYSFNQSICA